MRILLFAVLALGLLSPRAQAEETAPILEKAIAEAKARIATAEAFACDLQDKPCLNRELAKRYENDQWVRQALFEVCAGEDFATCPLIPVWQELDASNLQRIDAVLTAYGWPAGEGWSNEAELAAWFVVQHTPEDWPKDWKPIVLPDVKRAVAAGRLTGWHYAAMYDRYEQQQGRPQLYGTQSVRPDGLGKPCRLNKLADPGRVNALRAELGMEPLSAEAVAGAGDDE